MAGHAAVAERRYLVWKGYQRRAEVLARRMGATPLFLEHRFRGRALRPLDYAEKLARSLRQIRRARPDVVIVQAPPAFTALPAALLGVPYVVDAHNGLVQGWWGGVPGTRRFLERAAAVVVHNDEVAGLARARFPGLDPVVVMDPVEAIPAAGEARTPGQVLVIASFGADEPVSLMIDVFRRLPAHTFVVTADPARLDGRIRNELLALGNVRLTGFLPVPAYHAVLTESAAALVLTTRPATQPSGACEALSSDSPLVVSRTSLTERLFGEWATLVRHDAGEIAAAIQGLDGRALNLAAYRERWNARVEEQIVALEDRIGRSLRGRSR